MNKLFLAGGVAAAAAIAYVAQLAYKNFTNKSQAIPKDVVVQKLIDMKQLLYPIFFEIADVVATKLIPKGIPPDQARMFIMQSEQLAFRQNISTILREKVYFDMDQQTLQQSIQNEYKDDKEVQFYKKAFQEEYEKCFLGIKPQPLSTRMILINKQTILTIVTSLLQNKLARLREIVHSCKTQGTENSLNGKKQTNSQFIEKLESKLMKDENQDDLVRQELCNKYKIEDSKTFEFAIAKLLKESSDFKEKYQNIHDQFKQSVNQVMMKIVQ